MKKKLLALLMGTSLVFSLAACGGGEDEAADTGGDTATEETASAAGEELYNEKGCVNCHGGDLASGMHDISKVGASLSADEIKGVILNGQGAMPAQNVSDEEATELADWLATKK